MAELSLPGNRSRFISELEFIQCLASPSYIHFLAQKRYYQDPAFKNFLVYLRYWKRPEYACYLRFPQCLAFLDMMTGDEAAALKFWEEMCKVQFRDFVHQQVFRHWQFSQTARDESSEDSARQRKRSLEEGSESSPR